jgi:hypothetical protein
MGRRLTYRNVAKVNGFKLSIAEAIAYYVIWLDRDSANLPGIGLMTRVKSGKEWLLELDATPARHMRIYRRSATWQVDYAHLTGIHEGLISALEIALQ